MMKNCTANGIEYIYKPSNKYKLKFMTNGQERFIRAETPGEVHGGTHFKADYEK